MGSRFMRAASEIPVVGKEVEKFLEHRAEWMVREAGVREFLAPKIRYADQLAGKVEQGVSILSIGAGKGHELNEMDSQLPGSKITAVDPHDHWTRPLKNVVDTLAHHVEYLPEGVSAEHLQGVEDESIDGITLFFVLHHIPEESYERVMQEVSRVLKPDGYLFIAEDLVDSEEERKVVERADRIINVEISNALPHTYANIEQWRTFFEQHGFEMVRDHEVKPDNVRHGFFVLRRMTPNKSSTGVKS